jgi:hypothetical protein
MLCVPAQFDEGFAFRDPNFQYEKDLGRGVSAGRCSLRQRIDTPQRANIARLASLPGGALATH